jgi:holo-[acyl-carrier protein] synthase
MVYNRDNGKPEIRLAGTAKRAFEVSCANRIHVSLTHERENAVAMVVLEGA